MLKRISLIFFYAALLAFGFAAGTFFSAPARAAITPVYALVTAEDAYLFRENKLDTSVENRYFVLPKTYFVQILDENASTGLHRVRYKDIEGFVLASKIEVKDYTPKSIYPPDVTLHINIDGPSVNVRSLPDTSVNNVIATPPATATGIYYYNVTLGADSGGQTSTWYFVKYMLTADSVIKGYVQSSYVVLDQAIPQPNDTTAVIPTLPAPDPGEELPPISSDERIRVIVIIAVCIPAVAIVYLLFKPIKKKTVTATTAKKNKNGEVTASTDASGGANGGWSKKHYF